MNNQGTMGDYVHQQHVQMPVHSAIVSTNNMFGNQAHAQQHYTSAHPVQTLTLVGAPAPPPQHQMQPNLTSHQQTTTEVYMRQQTVEVESVVNLEQCCVCSTYFEPSGRSIPHPDLNRIICKVLDVTPASSFYKDYLSLCVNCTNLLRKFDRLLVELEFTKTQLVTYVVESLTQIRVEGGSQLDCLKSQIIDRWTSGQRDTKRKGKEKEGYSAAGTSGGGLSWAAHNNVMKNSSVVNATTTVDWKVRPEATTTAVSGPSAEAPADPDYPSDNDHGGDDFLHASDDGDDNEVTEERVGEEKHSKIGENPLETDVKPKRKRKRQNRKKSGPLVCVNCGRIFSQRTTYNGHVQVCVSDDLSMEKNCSICTEEANQPCLFETWEEFKTHVHLYHPIVKLEACAVCRINFLPHGIKYHKCSGPYRSGVDKEAIFQCDRCDKAYNTRSNLVDHVRRIHKDEQHKCDICNKVYGSPMLLGFHVARHNRVVSKYQCKQCGVCCTTNYGLKEHTKIHTGEQPFDCKVCGKKFSSLSQLKTHASVHGDSKPHVCHVCGKGFKNRSTLGRHVGRHLLDDSDYRKKCPVCPSVSFRRVWILKQHMEIRHPNTAALEEVLEKYKGIDDAPKGKRSRGRKRLKSGEQQLKESVSESEETDEDEDNEDASVVEEFVESDKPENSDADDVKPCLEGTADITENSATAETAATTPSRQSARLMGKCKTKKILVVLANKDIAKDS